MLYLPSSPGPICLHPVRSPLLCERVVTIATPKTDEDGWDTCGSLHSSSASQSAAVYDEHGKSTSLHSSIIKWREGIPLGYPDNETLEYWELIGPLSSSPLFMTTSPTCTSFLATPPSSPQQASTVRCRNPIHLSNSAVSSLVYNVEERFRGDRETHRLSMGTRSSDDEYSSSDCVTECTVVDDSRKGFGIVPTLLSYFHHLLSRTSAEI